MPALSRVVSASATVGLNDDTHICLISTGNDVERRIDCSVQVKPVAEHRM